MENDQSHFKMMPKLIIHLLLRFQDRTPNAKSKTRRSCMVLSPADEEPIINKSEETNEKAIENKTPDF